jgi:hypothetical protein
MITYPLPKRKSTYMRPPPQVRVTNVNVTRIFVSWDGGIVMMFDGPVTVDQASPPTTWSFNGSTSLQPGSGFNFVQGTYLVLNGVVSPGNTVVIGADDPAARTPSGGFVNGGTFTVEDI